MKKTGVICLLFLIFLACQKHPEQEKKMSGEFETADETKITEPQTTVAESLKQVAPEDNVVQGDIEKPVEQLTRVDQIEIAGDISANDLWETYNQLKNNINIYKDNWDFENLIDSLEKAANVAIRLNRPDIASWQYNNIGYYSIIEFKKRTDYSSRMKDLEIMPYGDEKKQYIQETRDKLRNEFFLLESARESLYDAMEMNSQAPDKDRERIIDSNVRFINSINDYLNS